MHAQILVTLSLTKTTITPKRSSVSSGIVFRVSNICGTKSAGCLKTSPFATKN